MLQWYIEQIGDTKVFKLSAGSINAGPAPTVDQDGKLVTDLSGLSATNWTVTECGQTCEEGVFMYVCLDSAAHMGINTNIFLQSITDDEGNSWQTPRTNDTDPQVRESHCRKCLPGGVCEEIFC